MEKRLEHTDEKYAANSKTNAAKKADFSVNIHKSVTIIPPPHAPFLLKPCGGSIFYGSTDDGRNDKNKDRLLSLCMKKKH